jgi:small subunit ribosomal protein S6
MPLYEHVFIARQDISPQQVDALTEQFKDIISGLGGSVGKTEYWGLRNFAYRMKRYRKGHYVLMNIDAPPAALKELERQEGINEDVMRGLTVRVETLETEPSAVMQNRGRDDRDRGDRDRGPRGGGGGRFGDRDRGEFRGDRDRGEDRGGGGYRGRRDEEPSTTPREGDA